MRALYATGLAYIGLCAGLFWFGRPGLAPAVGPQVRPTHPPSSLNGPEWFRAMKPFCNPVEVDTRIRFAPPPAGGEGAAYGAGCLALAGKIERARSMLLELPPGARQSAANIVFELAHPVADAGDDRAAGPIMELVVEFAPGNSMALYHAGASGYALGHAASARRNLTRFLEIYQQADGWTSNARQMLGRLGPQ